MVFGGRKTQKNNPEVVLFWKHFTYYLTNKHLSMKLIIDMKIHFYAKSMIKTNFSWHSEKLDRLN